MNPAKKLPKIFEKIEKIEKIEKNEKTLLTFPGLPEPGCKEYCSWGSSGRAILFVGELRQSNSVRGGAQAEQFCSWGSSGRASARGAGAEGRFFNFFNFFKYV